MFPGLETLGSGGPIIAVLVVLSLLSLALIVVKTLQLWAVRSGTALRANAFKQWASGDKYAAQQALEAGRSPADRITAYAMAALAKGFRGPALEAELVRRGNEEVARMNHLIRVIELIAMIAPMMPHLAEELHAAIGGGSMAAEQAWPKFDPALVVDDEITLPVQVNGKKRGDVTVPAGASQQAIIAAALALDAVSRYLDGGEPRKVIVVPNRIVNIVV